MGVVKSHAQARRGEVYWVNLEPTVGTKIKKTRPALVISPDDMKLLQYVDDPQVAWDLIKAFYEL